MKPLFFLSAGVETRLWRKRHRVGSVLVNLLIIPFAPFVAIAIVAKAVNMQFRANQHMKAYELMREIEARSAAGKDIHGTVRKLERHTERMRRLNI